MNKSIDHHETSDTYWREFLRHERFRVIICKDNIQWILQRRKRGAGARWAALSYCVTREALSHVWTAHLGDLAPEIDLLPPTINARRPAEGETL